MPLPNPKKYDNEEKYIGACMSAQDKEDKSQDQKLAICYSTWEDRNKKENTMKKVIEIKEEVQIGDYLLEKGDKIKVLNEESIMFGEWDIVRNPDLFDAVNAHVGEQARVFHIYDNDIGIKVISNGTFIIQNGDLIVQREKLDYFKIEHDKIEMVDYRTDHGEYFIEVYMKDGYRITIDFRG